MESDGGWHEWIPVPFLRVAGLSVATSSSLASLNPTTVPNFVMSLSSVLAPFCFNASSWAHHSKKDGACHCRLVENVEHPAANIEGTESPQEVQSSHALLVHSISVHGPLKFIVGHPKTWDSFVFLINKDWFGVSLWPQGVVLAAAVHEYKQCRGSFGHGSCGPWITQAPQVGKKASKPPNHVLWILTVVVVDKTRMKVDIKNQTIH